jgi:arginine utilization protein RocB
VVWALVRGRTPRTLVMLGHYDTVGFDEYTALGASAGSNIALDPAALREQLVTEGAARAYGELLARDVEEEWRRPGTWMFGRGSLDMKSGLAAGLAALSDLAASADSLGGSVMFVATPDEENHSIGMRTALGRLLDYQLERAADFLGVLNLDYSDTPAAYRGALGKSRVALWVLGTPAHAARPFEAVDAAQIAARALRGDDQPAAGGAAHSRSQAAVRRADRGRSHGRVERADIREKAGRNPGTRPGRGPDGGRGRAQAPRRAAWREPARARHTRRIAHAGGQDAR